MRISTRDLKEALFAAGLLPDSEIQEELFVDAADTIELSETLYDVLFLKLGLIIVEGEELEFREEAQVVALFEIGGKAFPVPLEMSRYRTGDEAEAFIMGSLIKRGHQPHEVNVIGFLAKHGDIVMEEE